MSNVGPTRTIQPRLLRSTALLSAASLIVRGLNLVRALVLARLLVPSDFGLFGIAVATIGFAMIVGDIGAGAYLIYRARDDQRGIHAAFWLNLAFATLIAGLLAVAGRLLASLYDSASLLAVVAALAVGAWFQVAGFFPRDMLRARSRFRALAVMDVCAMALSVALAITLAAFHAGVWALVWSAVAYQVLTMISWHLATGWRPNTFPSFASLRLVSTFAGWYTAAALSWYLVTNADNFLVAKLLGLSGLGYYILAYNLASVPVMLVASPFGQVIIPRLAALHGDHDAFWDLYERSSRFMTTVATPICAGMAVAAPDLVVGLFGPKWSPSVAPLQVLLAYMAVRLLVVDPYAALGRFGASFAVGVGALLLEIAAILVLVSLWGLTGAALGVLVIVGGAHLAGLPICGASRTLGRRLWRSFPLIIATVSVVAIGIAVSNLTIRNAPQVAGHVPLAAITGIVVLALMLYVSRSYLTTVWSDLRGPGA